MYGRMQLADYLVSNALQINNACLQRLSELEGELTAQDLRLLTTSTRQLLSCWKMLHWSVGRVPYRDAVKRLQLADRDLPVLDNPFSRTAVGLLKKNSDTKTRRTICRTRDVLLGQMTQARLDPDLAERLARVFQEESTCWRDYSLFRQISDDDLIVNGIVRAYAQGRRRCVHLVADKGAKDGVWNKPRKLKRGLAWVRHSVNHLELLRPSLSDVNKTRLWYLQKLGMNLVKQCELDEFMSAVAKLDMKAKSRRRITRVAAEHKQRILKQRQKLFPRCYGVKKGEFLDSIREDVNTLGLQQVVLLPMDKVRSGELG